MSGDTILIQDALGDKVGKFIQLLVTFIGGFIVAFTKGWLLSLVLISCIPVLVIAGGAMALIMVKMSSRGQIAFAQAGNVVEQTIGGKGSKTLNYTHLCYPLKVGLIHAIAIIKLVHPCHYFLNVVF
ncbi:hypothetical protein P3S67_023576 [Capsicum chacoense]